MKKVIRIFLTLIIVFSLFGCNKKEEQIGIRGEIVEIYTVEERTSILIEGNIEEDTIYDKANAVIKDNTKIYKDEEKVNVENLKEGQTVEVIFDGPVDETHPVKGTGKTIKIIE